MWLSTDTSVNGLKKTDFLALKVDFLSHSIQLASSTTMS